MDHVEVDVVKISRAVEELKAEMLKAQWLLQHGTIHASEDHILDSLSGLVGLSYLLAKRLGFNYSRLDRVLYKHMEEWQKTDKLQLESEWGDLSNLLGYLVPEEE